MRDIINKLLIKTSIPDFMIIGAQKSGTTSLHNLLSRHPSLQGSKVKEIHYFDKAIEKREPLEEYKKNFHKSIFRKNLCFESTPNYMYQPNFPKEIVKLNPEIKVIIALRNPITRAYSAWNMFKQIFEKDKGKILIEYHDFFSTYNLYYKGRDVFPSFEECIEIELNLIKEDSFKEPAILRRGLYYQQIYNVRKEIKLENIKIIEANFLKNNTAEALHEITHFLSVPRFNNIKIKNAHVRKYESQLSSKTLSFLKKFYKEPNDKLYHLIGEEYNWDVI